VLHDEPRPPHRLNDKIPRDLETICLKAMAKEPRRRYQTAQELADDLRRWLRGEPIKARPVGVPERAWRWCRRNAAVAISAAAVLLLLATVAAVSSVAAVWLRQQRDTALASWNRAEQAEKDAEERLWQSLLDRARAGRWSGRMGRRFDSLQALHEAARLRPSLQLRSEAIACMTLVDMRVAREWKGLPPGGTALAFDVPIERYARSDDKGNISVRRVADDEEILRLPGPGLRAHFLQFSPNSQLLAAVYHHWSPPQLWVWDLDRRKTLLELAPGVHRQGFDFSPDSRLVAFGHKDGTICLYDLTSGKQVKRLVAGLAASSPGAIRFHPDGRRLAVASSQLPGVQVHELDTAKVTALPHPAGVIAVAWRADGKLLATAGRDYNIYLWDMADLDQPRAVLKGHQAEVVRVAFNQAGDLLASQGWDGTTRLWDSSTGRQLVSTDTKGAGPIHFSADDRLLAFGKVGVKVRLWEVARRQECRTCRGHVVQAQQGPWVVDISSGGRLMASSDLDGIRLWDLAAGGEVALLPPCAGGAVFHPAGESLFTYDPQGLLRWPIQAEPASAVGLQIGPPQKLAGAEVLGPPIRTPQGRTLVLVAGPDRAAVLDADTQRQTILEQSPPKLLHTAISPDGRWVAAGNWHESGVKVWNAASGKFVRELPAPGSARAFFSPDARWLITATGAEYRFWEVGCWQPGLVVSREGAGDLPGLAAFSGDGKHLAVAHSRKVIHLLDPTTGDRVAALEAPEPQQLLHLCFSPDGSRLAAACGTHVIQVWDLRLIRRQLQVMGLAWDLPDYPAAPERDAQNPLQVKVLLGDLASPASQPALPREERTRLAIEHYRRAAEAQPNDAEACKKLAFLYATAPVPLRDPQKALPLARKAVQLAPDNASCRHVLGVACYTAGRYREAVQSLQANLKCQEDRFLAFDLFVLALSHQKLGETARAQEYHELARRWSRMPNSLTPLYAEILNSYRAEAEAVLDERAR
jgi:WD40 repeat protein